MLVKSVYALVQWNGLTDSKVQELFEGIPSPWTVNGNDGTHITFEYDGTEMLDLTYAQAKITYGTTESVKTAATRGDSASYAFKSLHIGENAFAYRLGTSDMDPDGEDIFIFTVDNQGKPAIVWIENTAASGGNPAYTTFTAWNDTDNVVPPARSENSYTDSAQTEMCPFVIETEQIQPRYTPYAVWIPITSLMTDTGQLKSDFIPVKDRAGNEMFYNGYTAFT